MSQTWGLTEEIIRRARERGHEITLEEAAAIAAEESLNSSPESRTDGAPDVQVTGETPGAYYDDIETRVRQLQDGGASNPNPNDPGFATEGDLLQYRVGMSPEEYDAAKANQRYRTSQYRRPDLHPQQQLDLGNEDDQAQWARYLEDNPEAQQRYDPAAYEARMAEQRASDARDHAAYLDEKYGQSSGAGAAYLESQATGQPMDMNMVRTPAELGRISDRRSAEMTARGSLRGEQVSQEEADEARDTLRLQDERSGYVGAMGGRGGDGGHWGSQMPAVGRGPNGEVETRAERFARRTQERRDDKDARRRRVATNAMLAGPDPGRNMTNAFDMMGNPSDFGLTPNQQRALQYMLPGGQLAAEVDANNMRTATEMATAGLRSTLVPLVASGLQGGAGGGDVVPFSDAWRSSPQQQSRLKQMADTYGDDSVTSRGDMISLLEAEGMTATQAQLATDWAFDNTWQGYTQ